jgi:hypothetical protein
VSDSDTSPQNSTWIELAAADGTVFRVRPSAVAAIRQSTRDTTTLYAGGCQFHVRGNLATVAAQVDAGEPADQPTDANRREPSANLQKVDSAPKPTPPKPATLSL